MGFMSPLARVQKVVGRSRTHQRDISIRKMSFHREHGHRIVNEKKPKSSGVSPNTTDIQTFQILMEELAFVK